MFQHNQVEDTQSILTWPQKSHRDTSAEFCRSQSRFKGGSHRSSCPSRRRPEKHTAEFEIFPSDKSESSVVKSIPVGHICVLDNEMSQTLSKCGISVAAGRSHQPRWAKSFKPGVPSPWVTDWYPSMSCWEPGHVAGGKQRPARNHPPPHICPQKHSSLKLVPGTNTVGLHCSKHLHSIASRDTQPPQLHTVSSYPGPS